MIINFLNKGIIVSLLIVFSSFSRTSNLPSDQYKSALNTGEEQLIEVYKDIYTAMGFTEDPPKLKLLNESSGLVSYIDYTQKTIYFEKKALELCMTLKEDSKNAMALLLGHELAHYHFKHDWGKNFASSYSWKSYEQMNATYLIIKEKDETQADSMGSIFGYLAGYNTSGVAEILLPAIYKNYNLTDTMAGYPVLAKRINISQNNAKMVDEFIKIFETANFLLLIRKYQDAENLYEYLLNQGYNSREIYNNLGLAYVWETIEMTSDMIKYKYPFEIDMESRVIWTKSIFDSKVGDAIEKFKQAIKFDPFYSTSYLNLACAYSIDNKVDDAEYNLKKATELVRSQKTDSSGIYILNGVLSDQKGDKKSAKKYLGYSFLKENPVAIFDLAIVKGNPTNDQTNTAIKKDQDKIVETIDGINIFTEISGIRKMLKIKTDKYDILYTNNTTSKLFYIVPKEALNVRNIVFLKTGKSYTGQTQKGIKVKDNKSIIEQKYGKPDKQFYSRNGLILIYLNNKTMFFLDKDNLVESWLVFNEDYGN